MVEIHSLPTNWVIFDKAEEVASALAQKLLSLAQQAIAEKGAFTLVTAGGQPFRSAMNIYLNLMPIGISGISIWVMSAVSRQMIRTETVLR